jgi:hypothetical protein
MVKLSFIFVCVACISLLSCKPSPDKKPGLVVPELEPESSVGPISIDSFYKPQLLIDSLNGLKDFETMPYFLNDSCIDANVIYWNDLHHPASIRENVIEHTTNIELLKYIVRHKLFTNRCHSDSPDTSIPFYNQSWNDLIKERLDSLLKSH